MNTKTRCILIITRTKTTTNTQTHGAKNRVEKYKFNARALKHLLAHVIVRSENCISSYAKYYYKHVETNSRYNIKHKGNIIIH